MCESCNINANQKVLLVVSKKTIPLKVSKLEEKLIQIYREKSPAAAFHNHDFVN